MKISARVQNGACEHHVVLATCYCNDLYREAAFRGMKIDRVDVHVEGEFGSAGEPATGIVYNIRVVANAAESEILDVMRHTDTVAEIQRTLRVRTPVTLGTSKRYLPSGR